MDLDYHTTSYRVPLPTPCCLRWLAETSAFNSVAVRVGHTDDQADRHFPVLFRQLQDFDREFRQSVHDDALALDFLLEPGLLLLERAQEINCPRLPIRRVIADRALGAAQGEIVSFLALLDHAFQRAVRNIGIAATEQQERCQHAG